MTQAKKLIEVAMPIKEISAESVRDKSIRHGHISTLHLWWARRPLPVCRAVVFASLVPDPLDEHCPQAFRDAVEILLGSKDKPLMDGGLVDRYKPYTDIPWTAVFDPMEDNHRNRLQMFVGKFSEKMQQHLLGKEKNAPGAKDQLSDYSLIKWDNKNNEPIINKARKLIFVAHNATTKAQASQLLEDFEILYANIKIAETNLIELSDRHTQSEAAQTLEAALEVAKNTFLEKMPKVFDPFAGGGAIPLEAARLGCRSYGNDINPVAHIIQKGSLEFPQKFGKSITYSKEAFLKLYGQKAWNDLDALWLKYKDADAVAVTIPNRLSFDVEFYAKKLLAMAEVEIGHLYPSRWVYDRKEKKEKEIKPIAYYWAYEGTCSNPSCKCKVPLIKQFYLVNKPDKKVFLQPIINNREISFEIKIGESNNENWIQRKNLKCPVCGNITDIKELKRQFLAKEPTKRIISVVEESDDGKAYRLPFQNEIEAANNLVEIPGKPIEKMPLGNNRDLHCMGWGVEYWADMFSERQLLLMDKLTFSLKSGNIITDFDNSNEYSKSLLVYLAIFIDRIAAANTAFGRWNVSGEKLETPFSRQAIPFMLDFPESNPFSSTTGSALNQLAWITRYIESECDYPFITLLKNATSGDQNQFPSKYLDVVITDPPYYDAIAYADLSDFFYIWLKRMLGDVFQLNFAVPQTPKSDECTALKHHHNGNMSVAKNHFENKLFEIFSAIEFQTKDLVSIMFAHQSTEAWTTLCNAILSSRMNITGSWAMDTEMGSRMVAMDNAALQSSVTVACKPSQRVGIGDFKVVKKAIEKTVEKEVELLYGLGFRGADLLTGCFGQAVSEFGKYKKVEKADGSEVTVAELLELARESAFNALLKGFDGDDFTKFYIGWLQLYGFSESDFDDAAKFSRVGLTINVAELFKEHILIQNGNKQTLGGYVKRIKLKEHLGEKTSDNLIDQVHHAMALYGGTNRNLLLQFISKVAAQPECSFWRVITAISEILPPNSDDYKQAVGLNSQKDSLIKDSKQNIAPVAEQTKLEF